ncbi:MULTISPECIES: ABC transporter permease subunit [unclassified Kitasatospora]|uniref:ABC transporter permease subunit n=1 Tax=unclassified Kitasatospora TaxID=2633591 RepID=UPI001AE01F8B|nr:ABC transporter permease subunit [Kitasatospora sp. RG8]MBP0453385.1 ABC transporter permease subunit [Kitasatospora sp. RG8]
MSAVTAAPAALSRSGVLLAAWLRHRSSVRTLLGVLAALVLVLAVTGYFVHAGFDRSGAGGCDMATRACNERWKGFLREYGTELMVGGNIVYLLGGVLGAFAGGPLLAREFEHGTVRFAWTQGAGRTRWAVGGLAVVGGVLAAATAGAAVVAHWWIAPLDGSGSRFAPLLFASAPPALVGRVLLVFGLTVLAGAVLRRTVVAVGIGVAASVVTVLVAESLRFHYRTPLQDTVHTLAQSSVDHRWTGASWITDPAGNRIGSGELFDLGHDFYGAQKLVSEGGYTVHETYQPDDRYWSFQFVEFGWTAAVAVVLCAAALWWVRRRAV